jgi:catecholate siderophore receptor
MFVSKISRPESLRTRSMGVAPRAAGAAALSLSAAMLMPLAVHAQEAEQLETVKVQDTAIDPNPNAQVGVPYKARTSGDERRTRPLAETPATIQVLTSQQIEDSGQTDLRALLDGQPGITIGTGENGNAFGDRYIIRGQEARSDVFVDGLRDPGMTTRESFAIEQLEITKGPNSSFAGRGAAGGIINAITKQANTNLNFGRASLGVGTDDHVRGTLDVNRTFGDTFAVRGNLLYSKEDVPGFAYAQRERKGLALSGLYSPTDEFSAALDYYGLRADDRPDIGTYLVGGGAVKGVPVYTQRQDFQDSDVDTFTARLKYQFAPNVRISNLTRYGQSENGYVVTGARFANTSANAPGGAYPSATLSTHQGWQEVEYLANQTNLFVDTELFGRKHQFVFGLEYTDHDVLNGIYRVTNTGAFNCATGTSATPNGFCVFGPNGRPVSNLNTLLGRQITRGPWDIDWGVKSVSAYAMDTLDLTDRLTVFAGVRFDDYKLKLGTQNATTLAVTRYSYSDNLWNGHLGLTYKLTDEGMVYAAWASSADINGGESDVGTNSGYGGLIVFNGRIGAQPERSQNLEVGTKWNLFSERLLLTAALFKSTKSDVMEGANYTTFGTFNTGKNRVRGVEFGAAGAVTDKLSVQAGVTFMKSKVLKSATPANVGKRLSNFANASASVQARYQATEKFYFGGAARYEGKRYAGQPDTAAVFGPPGYTIPVPAYTVYDLFAAYQLTRSLEARVNVNNVTHKDYYLAGYRSGSFLYRGDGRSARFTLNYEF